MIDFESIFEDQTKEEKKIMAGDTEEEKKRVAGDIIDFVNIIEDPTKEEKKRMAGDTEFDKNGKPRFHEEETDISKNRADRASKSAQKKF